MDTLVAKIPRSICQRCGSEKTNSGLCRSCFIKKRWVEIKNTWARICLIDECDKKIGPHNKSGLCAFHYRERHYGKYIATCAECGKWMSKESEDILCCSCRSLAKKELEDEWGSDWIDHSLGYLE